MTANTLAATLLFLFFVHIVVRGKLTDYAGVLGLGPKA